MLDEMNDFEGQNKWQINEYTTTNKGIKKKKIGHKKAANQTR